VDPGETTGYAVWDTEEDRFVAGGVVCGEFRSSVDYIISLGDFFIVEDFRVRPQAARGLASLPRLWPVEWLGVLRYLVGDRMTTQTPAQAKAIKLVPETSDPHENDARRHVLCYLGRNVISSSNTHLQDALRRLVDHPGNDPGSDQQS
jgi:hypothetical protein